MDTQANQKDFELIKQDEYTFSVLARILKSNTCEAVRTDHERLILCHSCAPFPVWLWTPDNISQGEKEAAWKLSESVRPLSAGNRYNLKYELAYYFIDRAKEAGVDARILTRLFAYDCPQPISPQIACEGTLHCCTEEDIPEAAELVVRFHDDINENPLSIDAALKKVEKHIARRAFYFWKDDAGRTVACCSYRMEAEKLACMTNVYTLPEHRRKHYAQNLVYQVTKLAFDMGLTPILYTDADYVASNACYEKIGYTLLGKLCTIGI